jgi:hypothetical protein
MRVLPQVSAFLMASVVLISLPAAAECRQRAEDAFGDHSTAPYFGEPADILEVQMIARDEGLEMRATLEHSPRVETLLYSYWIGFDDGGSSAAGNTATWTFQGTSTYHRIRTMYWAEPFDLPVTWDGSTFSFLVAWEYFEAAYGPDYASKVGSPHMTSSGPYAPGPVAINNPGQDWLRSELPPLLPCPMAAPEPAQPDDAPDQAVPVPLTLVVLALVLASLAARRR